MGKGQDIKQPADFSGQDANFSKLSNQNTQVLNGYAPQVAQTASGITNSFLNNPYAAGAQAGANTYGAYGTSTVVPTLQQGSTALQGIGNQASSFIPQTLQSGFDPQNALYAQKYQQMLDQQNAINSMSGVGGTPYGAGVTGTASQNFNLDWLDRALGRQQTAAGTAGQLAQTAGLGYTGAGTLGNQAITTGVTSTALPSQQYQQNLAQQLQALSGQNAAIGGATSLNEAQMAQIMSYLGLGVDSSAKQAQVDAQAMGGLGSMFGSLLGLGTGGGNTVGGSLLGLAGLGAI